MAQDMEISLSFQKYFCFLEELKVQFEDAVRRFNKALIVLENLSEQLQAVSKSPDDCELVRKFPALKSALRFKILMAIEQQLSVIVNIIDEMENLINSLSKHLTVVEVNVTTSNVMESTERNEIFSAPFTVDHLWECVLDSHQYYLGLYSEIRTAFHCLDVQDSCTVLKLKKSVLQKKNLQRHLNKCMAVGRSLCKLSNPKDVT